MSAGNELVLPVPYFTNHYMAVQGAAAIPIEAPTAEACPMVGAGLWSAASEPGWWRNVVVLGTFSKSFAMMGWRVGYLLADASGCEQATKIQDAMIICAPVISMAAEGAVRDDWLLPDVLPCRGG